MTSWVKTNRYRLVLLGIIVFFFLVYFHFINHRYIESSGDNYSYEIFAQTVFDSQPFKVNVKFDFYDEHPIYHHQRSFPPLYPIFLAVMHFLFGKSMLVNFYATSVIAVLCALPVFFLGKLLWSERAGVMAAAVTLLFPTLRDTAVLGMSEPLFTFLSLWSLYYLVSFVESGLKRELVYSGVFSGLAYLTRTAGVALVAAELLFLFFAWDLDFDKAALKKRGINLLLFLGVVLLVTGPWLIRNYRIFDDPFYYVGRFFTGQKPGTLYASLDRPTLSKFLSSASLAEIFSRYGKVAALEAKMVYSETGIVSLLVIYGIGAGYFRAKKYLLFWLYLFFGFVITFFNPGLHVRHMMPLFPVMGVLGVITLASFHQFLRYRSFEDYLKDSLFRQAFLLLALMGVVLLGYQSLRHYQPVTPFSQMYPEIGKWFQENTPAGTVIMSDPAPSIHYQAQRPVVMFPRPAKPAELSAIIEKYQVEYIVVLYQDQIASLPKEELTMVKKFSSQYQGKELRAMILKKTNN